ncbi:HNH endonuclease [Roseomonas sp. NAR14]|uniref:HNH endonuclease n=1 Tax=Roseomonas acroporae TaxID=2937791 RepID=A0A9X1YD16_9PROT|nr:HNH endonuclease [Roseomonas acroporae]MCK8784306.1 HNH endonuclease [Roseomonas acroporae]
MSRRHERRAARQRRDAPDTAPADPTAPPSPASACALCLRPIPAGARASRHHLTPRLKGGTHRGTVLLHQICHSAIHARFGEAELARRLADVPALRAEPALAEFLRWVARRPPGFHAPTRRARRR